MVASLMSYRNDRFSSVDQESYATKVLMTELTGRHGGFQHGRCGKAIKSPIPGAPGARGS
jgi:hypothetical protein